MSKNARFLKPSFDKEVDKREVMDHFLYENIDTIYLYDNFGKTFNIAGRICIKNRYYKKYYYFALICLGENAIRKLFVMTDPNLFLPLIFIKANVEDDNNSAFIISYASVSGNKQILHHPTLFIHAVHSNSLREDNNRHISLSRDGYGDPDFFHSLLQFFELHDKGFIWL